MLVFQSPFGPTVFFCAPRVVLAFRWGLQSTRSQSMVLLSRWRAHKFTLRTQTQPNSIHPTQARELQSNGLLSFDMKVFGTYMGVGIAIWGQAAPLTLIRLPLFVSCSLFFSKSLSLCKWNKKFSSICLGLNQSMIISKSDCGCSLRVAIELFEPSQVVLVVPIPLVLSISNHAMHSAACFMCIYPR